MTKVQRGLPFRTKRERNQRKQSKKKASRTLGGQIGDPTRLGKSKTGERKKVCPRAMSQAVYWQTTLEGGRNFSKAEEEYSLNQKGGHGGGHFREKQLEGLLTGHGTGEPHNQFP